MRDAGSRDFKSVVRWLSVRPLSIMSSTIKTCLPVMLVSMSLEMRTMPEVFELLP